MSYEQGFSAGERQAWDDRSEGRGPRDLPPPRDDTERGFADGYVPRSASWWTATQAQCWWAERRRQQEVKPWLQ